MRPIRTLATNFVYLCPDPAGDAMPCTRTSDGRTISVWEPTTEERARIAAGANVELHCWMQPPPPVGFVITDHKEVPPPPDPRVPGPPDVPRPPRPRAVG
jgi:hypothetical protein